VRRPLLGVALLAGRLDAFVAAQAAGANLTLVLVMLAEGFKRSSYTVLGLTAAVGAVRRGTSATAAPRRLARLGAGAILACVVFGVAAGLTVRSDTRRPGDVLLTITPSVESSPRSLTVDAGRVSILVRNQSNHRNTLTIDGVVTREVPARSTKRVTFTVASGEYRFYSESAADDTAGTLIAR
jgi:hypothetical protein